jgi:hypothetical protein
MDGLHDFPESHTLAFSESIAESNSLSARSRKCFLLCLSTRHCAEPSHLSIWCKQRPDCVEMEKQNVNLNLYTSTWSINTNRVLLSHVGHCFLYGVPWQIAASIISPVSGSVCLVQKVFRISATTDKFFAYRIRSYNIIRIPMKIR